MLKETIQEAIKNVDNMAFFGTEQAEVVITLHKSLPENYVMVVASEDTIEETLNYLERFLREAKSVVVVVPYTLLECGAFTWYKVNPKVSWWCVTSGINEDKRKSMEVLEWKNNFMDTYGGLCVSCISGMIVGASKRAVQEGVQE